jgi:CheY-like chemotaxis protein
MKTSYNIIWVDDDPTSTETDQEDVSEFLEEYGIRADITIVEAPADGSIREKLEHHLLDPELDLLLVDYHMEGLNGDQLVKLIRQSNHVYLPVIFYSSSPVQELYDAVRDSALDGVYIANRDFFINKVRDVVQSLLVKEQTVKQVRGLLMEGVSEIDTRFQEIFFKVWEDCSAEKKTDIHKYLSDIVKDRAKSAAKKHEKFPDHDALDEHLKESFLTAKYDTYTRWRLTRKLLELVEHTPDDIDLLKEFAEREEGQQSLNSLRNDYAHKSRQLLTENHTPERCIEIRRDLRAQFANIDSILGTE